MILNALAHSFSDVVEVGAAYRRRGTGALIEVAYVLDVAPDKMGIPHVKFELQVARCNHAPSVETRTLALEVFQNRYRERIAEGRGPGSNVGN
jgi:hypothetical protein